MIIFAVNRKFIMGDTNPNEHDSLAWVENISNENISSFDKNKFILFPWFLIYKTYDEFSQRFYNFSKIYFTDKRFITLLDSEVKIENYNSISQKVLSTYANPNYGKIPEQAVTKNVCNDEKENIINWHEFFIKRNDYNGFPSQSEFASKWTNSCEGMVCRRNNNKAEYTLCFASEKEIFNDLLAKIIAKLSGNDKAAKQLARTLAEDSNDILYKDQKIIVEKLTKSLNDKIKTLTGSTQQNVLKIKYDNSEYYNYYANNTEFLKTNVKKFPFLQEISTYKCFYNLVQAFIADKIKNGRVAIGALIINDLRKIYDKLKLIKHDITGKLVGNDVTGATSRIFVSGNEMKEIERTNFRFNQIGRASYNFRDYTFEDDDESALFSNPIALRNRLYHIKGFQLGNGISGHIAGILAFTSANCSYIESKSLEATVASSLFLFWSLYYDKRSTAVHSYIEVFEAISNLQQNEDENVYHACLSNTVNKSPYESIKILCLENKFSALEFLECFKLRKNK